MMSFSVFQTSSFATTYLFGCDLFKTFSFLSKEQELKKKKTTSSILPFMSYFKKAYEKLEKLRIKELYELGDLFLDLLTLFVSFYLMAGQD